MSIWQCKIFRKQCPYMESCLAKQSKYMAKNLGKSEPTVTRSWLLAWKWVEMTKPWEYLFP